jgi:hypothetical protein
MNLIQKIISIQGELNLPINAGTFERAFKEHTYAASSEAEISGHVVKFDEEDYAQSYYGHIGNGQFQLRAVKKRPRLDMANFLIQGIITLLSSAAKNASLWNFAPSKGAPEQECGHVIFKFEQ